MSNQTLSKEDAEWLAQWAYKPEDDDWFACWKLEHTRVCARHDRWAEDNAYRWQEGDPCTFFVRYKPNPSNIRYEFGADLKATTIIEALKEAAVVVAMHLLTNGAST